jgi:hypothetical protein
MNQFTLLGITQALASMVAQNTNTPPGDVEETAPGHQCRFLAETQAGWLRVTVDAMDNDSPAVPVYDTRNDNTPAKVPPINDAEWLDDLWGRLSMLADLIDREECVPERYASTLAGELAEADSRAIRQALYVIARIERWAGFTRGPRYVKPFTGGDA